MTKVKWKVGADSNPEFIEVCDTYKVQLTSLLLFAKSIGYILTSEFDGKFIDIYRTKSPMRQVKFITMVGWHNNSFQDGSCWHSFEQELPKVVNKYGFSVENIKRAIDSKLVRQVYLQDTKNGIIVQRHMIQFA